MSIQSEIDRIRGNVNASLRAVAEKGVNVQESDGSNELPSLIASIPTPDVSGQIAAHNTNTEAHNDIRELITGLTNRLNALADSDDTTLDQLSEIVAYIKANRSLIESITTSKVNVADIINNLTTNVSNKPLSAAQGVALKALIDAITVPTKVSELENDSGYLTSYMETDPTVPAWAKSKTKPTYTASEVGADVSGAAAAVQSNLDGHTGNTTVHITASERTGWNGKSEKSVAFTVTLTAGGWSGNAQTVSNSKFITSGYAYTVCPAGDSFAGYAEAVIYADDVTTAGKMTFHCNEAPTENLTVNILRTEVTA